MVGRPIQQSLPHGEEESIAANEPAGRNKSKTVASKPILFKNSQFILAKHPIQRSTV